MDIRNQRKIQYISFFLALSVVSIHTYNIDIYELTDGLDIGEHILVFVENLLNRLQSICVPFFFLISGYLFFRNYSWDKVIQKYKSRIKSLLIPYILWCTIYFGIYLVITNLPIIAVHMNMGRVPLSFRYYIECLWNSTYTVLWFVKNLILTIIGAPVYYGLFKKKNKFFWKAVSILGSIILLVYSRYFSTFLNIYFLIGSLLSLHASKYVESREKIKIIMGALGIVIGVFWMLLLGEQEENLWVLFMIVSIWNTLDGLDFNKAPAWWQKQTFFFYCAHSFALEALEKLWLVVAGKHVWAAALDYIFMPIVVVGLLSLMAYILNKYCGKLYGVLIGGRNG